MSLYCLRSISQNMPWIRKIYILQNSDANVPSFFSSNYEENGIYLFNHEHIILDRYLPTTNSDSIETFITQLPGLSEHFIYFNDDCFVMKHIPIDYFFTSKGIPKKIIEKRQYLNANNQKIKIKVPPSPGELVWHPHIPLSYTKTQINKYLNDYSEFIEYIRSIKSRKNIEESKTACYNLGLTYPCMQLNTNVAYNTSSETNGETEQIASEYLKFPHDLLKINQVTKKFLCLGDHFEGSNEERTLYRNQLKNILDIIFPIKSRAEI
jgi:hypothetical protein